MWLTLVNYETRKEKNKIVEVILDIEGNIDKNRIGNLQLYILKMPAGLAMWSTQVFAL